MRTTKEIISPSTALLQSRRPKIVIRDFKRGDLTKMTELENLCFPPKQVFSRETLVNFIYHYDSVTLCIENSDNKELLGFLIFTEINLRVWELMTIEVNPSVRKKGFGTKLLSEGLTIVEKYNPSRIILHAAVDNTNALNLYHKFGFNIVKSIRNYYNDGQNAYLMYKEYGHD